MTSTKVKKSIDFTGKQIYVGMDIHKKSWTVTILTEQMEHKTFQQPPCPDSLVKYLEKFFPGANYHAVYEAGRFGFWISRQLKEKKVNCRVVNPADIPTTNKEDDNKRDSVDSRKLAKTLRAGLLDNICIPSRQRQEDRGLVRRRRKLRGDLTRIQNRIKSMLAYYGISIPPEYDNSHWSMKFINWLEELNLEYDSGQDSLDLLIEQFKQLRELVLKSTRCIRQLAKEERYKLRVEILTSVPGIGLITAMTFLTEIGSVDRFPRTSHLCSMIGIKPSTNSSGEKERVGHLTQRKNRYLSDMLIESAWVAVRKDPALLRYFEQLTTRMAKNKAIIRIVRKLINRIRYLLLNKQHYQIGIVA